MYVGIYFKLLLKPVYLNIAQKWGNYKSRRVSPAALAAVKTAFLVEVTGLEPAASCSQSKRATNCATPRYLIYNCPLRFLLPLPHRASLRLAFCDGCHSLFLA